MHGSQAAGCAVLVRRRVSSKICHRERARCTNERRRPLLSAEHQRITAVNYGRNRRCRRRDSSIYEQSGATSNNGVNGRSLSRRTVDGTDSGVARNLRQGVCKVVLPLPFLPFRTLSLPFPSLSLLSSPSHSFPLEVGPLNTARESGGTL